MEKNKRTEQERWSDEIVAAEKELDKFHKRADSVTRRFLDERETMNSDQKWFNIFYANTNILESALYSQLPKPSVTRRFKDYDDDQARVAGVILQRCITQDLDDPRDTFDATLRACVQDRLVPGLSVAWLRLETDTEDNYADDLLPPGTPDAYVGEDSDDYNEADAPQKITDQRVCVDYVYWRDFIWSPCRVWNERRWVGRKVYMSKDEAEERFGEEKAKTLTFGDVGKGARDHQGSTPINNALDQAIVYEIWERATKKVFWFNKSVEDLLDEVDDPLGLVGFEPCPEPMLANTSTSNTAPRPDYYMLQDQYRELDDVNNRISMLVKACKVIGVYDKSAEGVQRMLKEGSDNMLIPVDNWAMFSEKNGLKGTVDWLPLESVVTALNQLNMAREAIKAQIYELTGISDIVRGATKASETLGAQEIKAKFASVRIKKLQDEVARFASSIMRIKAEIMVKHFEPEILLRMSNIMTSPDAPIAQQAIAMLKEEAGFEWRVQVTADSIAQADYSLEKADRLEFLTAVGSYLEKGVAMVDSKPETAPLIVGMLKWAVAGFRNAAEIEGMLDKELDNMTKQPIQPKVDPEMVKMQAEQQAAMQQAQMEQQQAQQTAQFEQQVEMQRLQMEQQAAQQTAQLEQQTAQQSAQLEQQRYAMEMDWEQKKLSMEMANEERMNNIKLQFEQALNEIKLSAAKAQAAVKPKGGDNGKA